MWGNLNPLPSKHSHELWHSFQAVSFNICKADIYDHLDSARQSPQKRVPEFVELLEDKSVLTQRFGTLKISKNIKIERNRYSYFYKKYIIYVFNHFIFEEDDVEIMLVAFNYHPDFEYETRIKYRRDLFARRIYEPKKLYQ